MIFKIILGLIIAYIIVRSIIPFIIFPGYLFNYKIKRTPNIKKIAKTLKGKTKEKTLRNIFKYVIRNHSGLLGSTKRFFILKNAFLNDIEKLLENKIYLYCHNSNLMMKTLLVNTKQFNEEDIEAKWELGTNLGVHQYLLISSDKNTFKVDPFFRILERLKK